MPKQAFISHCAEDRKAAYAICRLLEEAGIACWIAPRDVSALSDYAPQIIRAIENCVAMVLILSRKANASEHVAREVERACSKGKTLIVFRIEEIVAEGSLEYFSAGKQRIDGWEPPPLGERVQDILNALRELIPAEPGPQEPILPRPVDGPVRVPERTRRRGWRNWAIAGVAAAAALAVIAVVVVVPKLRKLEPSPPTVPPVSSLETPAPGRIKITVTEFEIQHVDDERTQWLGKGLQSAFNTELSQITQLSVIAPEIIQHTARESKTDAMGAAEKLGVPRVMAGSFSVYGNTLRIDVRVVDPTSGVQEFADKVEGSQTDFLSLRNQLIQRTVEHFGLQLTEAEKAALHKKTNSPMDKYRKFLGAEGVTQGAPAADAEPPPPETGKAGPPADHASNGSWLVLAFRPSVALAQAADAGVDAAVRQVLEEYRHAQETGNVEQLAALYVALPESQRKEITEYLQGVKNLKVDFADVQVHPRGEHDVAVSYTRRDRFEDKDSGEPVSLEVRVTKFMVQDGGKWKFGQGG